MAIRSKLLVGLTAGLLVSSSCHGAEIDLNDLLPDPGQAGAPDGVVVATGGDASDEPGNGGIGEPDMVAGAGGASGAGGDFSEVAGSGGSGELDDLTPPFVLSISPSDGERGVRSDSKIVIRFSEPMNRVQTASGSELVDIPVSAEWDELGTELSLTPVEELTYGWEEAVAYTLRVNRLAMDLAGNALEEQLVATFYTSRRLGTSFLPIASRTGYAIDSNDPPSVFADPTVGDAVDREMRGFASFELSSLPPPTQEVTSAALTVGQYTTRGEPYQLGSMLLEHVAFSAVSQALRAPAKASFGVLFSGLDVQTTGVDVASALRVQLAERGDDVGQLQFRFRFEQAANTNGVTDEVRLYPIKLDVSYLAP